MLLTTNLYSNENSQLGLTNQLGRTLNVYRIKPELFQLGRKICGILFSISLVCLTLGIIGLAITFVADLQQKSLFQTNPTLVLSFPLCLLLVGSVNLFLCRIMQQQIRTQRVLICEYGLLKITRKIKSNGVEVVRWQDISEVRQAYVDERFAYAIISREGKILPLTNDYPNIDEMVAQIKQRCKETQPKA